MGILSACMFGCISEEGIRPCCTPVIDSCKLLCRFWESNSGLLEKQPVLLTDEPSF